MDIKLGDLAGTWKVLGQSDETTISVAANQSVKITLGEGEMKQSLIIPLSFVVALQTDEAMAFIRSPLIAPFLWANNERKPRVNAAKGLANIELGRQRREFVAAVQAYDATIGIGEAWDLARLKYPSDSDRKLESERKTMTAKLIRKNPKLTHQQAEGMAYRKIRGPDQV